MHLLRMALPLQLQPEHGTAPLTAASKVARKALPRGRHQERESKGSFPCFVGRSVHPLDQPCLFWTSLTGIASGLRTSMIWLQNLESLSTSATEGSMLAQSRVNIMTLFRFLSNDVSQGIRAHVLAPRYESPPSPSKVPTAAAFFTSSISGIASETSPGKRPAVYSALIESRSKEVVRGVSLTWSFRQRTWEDLRDSNGRLHEAITVDGHHSISGRIGRFRDVLFLCTSWNWSAQDHQLSSDSLTRLAHRTFPFSNASLHGFCFSDFRDTHVATLYLGSLSQCPPRHAFSIPS